MASCLASQRGNPKPQIFIPFQVSLLQLLYLILLFQGSYIDVEAALGDIEHAHPIVVGFGENLCELTDPRLVIKKNNVICISSFLLAVECCLSSYYVFNIKYPSNSNALCLLLEFMFGIKETSSNYH